MLQKHKKKAIFIDIDGTLLSDGRSVPSEYTIEQLRRVQKQGDMIFLNTGRSFGYIPQELREADYIDGIVAGGGAHVVLKQRTIYRCTISEDVLCEVSRLYLSLGKWCLFEGEEENYGLLRPGFRPVEHEDDFRTRYRGASISKITMQGFVGEEEREVLHSHFVLFKHSDYSEGFIRGESKTGGIERILSATGIDKRQTVGIGDSFNDVEMLINTEFGIAMGNACAELKQIADVITKDCRHDGVGVALEQYLVNSPT